MSIFNLDFGQAPALIDGDTGEIVSYAKLRHSVERIHELVPDERALIFLFSSNQLPEVISYLSALHGGHVVCLLDAQMHSSFKQKLISLYQPHWIFGDSSEMAEVLAYRAIASPWEGLAVYRHCDTGRCPALHPDLQLLLTTSGTTGSPKLIRLSRANLLSNATSIAQYLALQPTDRAIASLPFHYSYGLSVLHSHILAGASLALTSSSPAQAPFWQVLHSYACTSLAGVPYTYTLLDRIGFEKLDLPSLKMLTQAGGRLDSSLTVKFHAIMDARGGSFFSMYGQTEATARIAYLPPSYLPQKAGSIGIAIPGGQLHITTEKGIVTSAKETGELIYKGPNVMLGYASTAADLLLGDTMQGILPTGDLGYYDEDGIFFLTGRLKRIAKIYGLRLNLDDIERTLSAYGSIAVIANDTQLCIYIEDSVQEVGEECVRHLAKLYHLHPTAFRYHIVPQLPRNASGKVDYSQLTLNQSDQR